MRCLAVCLIALILGPVAVNAADQGTPGPAGTHRVDDTPASYLFEPGDVIDVTVSSHQGYDRTITIQPDGRVYLPVAGEIVAAGLTAPQLAARIQKGLTVELVDPEVAVSLKELNHGLMRRVSVLGAVKSPGVFELKQRSSLAEMLAAAGGPTPVADLRHVTITHGSGGNKAVADLSRTPGAGDAGSEQVLEPGDVVFVPEGVPPVVMVLGEVAKPGSYTLQGVMRLMDALSLAGGPTTKADLRRVAVTHAGKTQEELLDVQEFLTTGQPGNSDSNILIQPGDTIILPESQHKFYVIGEVNKAEAYPLKPKERLLDAVTAAGGSTHEADLSRVMLVRKDAKGQAVARRVDIKRMMNHGDMAGNELLQEGDVVFVPNRKPPRDLTNFLYPLSGLFGILRAF
jgi:polysaccharide export outer membrane protein